MFANIQADMSIADEPQRPSLADNSGEVRAMREPAMRLAARLSWLPRIHASDTFSRRCRKLAVAFKALFERLDTAFARAPGSEDLIWLRDNAQQLSATVHAVANDLGQMTRLPHVRRAKDEIVPRVLAIAQAFFDETGNTFCESKFTAFCLAFEETTALEFHEVGALVPALRIVLLERIVEK